MTSELQIGTPPISVRLRRSPRARRFTLRLAAGTGDAILTVPDRARDADVWRFLADQEDWIRSRQQKLPAAIVPEPGGSLPFLGQPLALALAGDRRIRHRPGELHIPGPPETFCHRLAGWMKAQARDRLAARCDVHAKALAVNWTRITLRDTRSRWGSCSSDGRLMFSWRLVMAPEGVLDYVALHEVAHRLEMNHSDRYWAIVAGQMPDYRKRRNWLTQHGPSLHRYRF